MADSLKLVRNDNRVTSLMGNPIKAYGQDTGSDSRRSTIERYDYTGEDGIKYHRIRYTIEGPSGSVGHVYVEKKDKTKRDDFNYLIISIEKPRPMKFALVDNREVLPIEIQREKLIDFLISQDTHLFVSGMRKPESIQQLNELGSEQNRLNIIDCDVNLDLCKEFHVTSTPSWRIGQHYLEGFLSLQELKDTQQKIMSIKKAKK